MSDTPWEDKFEALPPWAKKLVRGVEGLLVHGSNDGREGIYPIFDPPANKAFHFNASFRCGHADQWSSGFSDMVMFATHLAAERKKKKELEASVSGGSKEPAR